MAGMYPVVGDIVEQRVVCALGNQVAMNIFHYGVGAITSGGASLLEMATAMDALLAPLYKDLMDVAATYRGVGMTNVIVPRTIEYVSTAGIGFGTQAGNSIPTQVRGLISYQGNAAGPRNRGRQYIPFPSVTALTASGLVSTTYSTSLTNLRAVLSVTRIFIGATGNTTVFPVVAHRPFLPSNWSTVTQMFARTKFGTQRKSGAYGRPNTAPF